VKCSNTRSLIFSSSLWNLSFDSLQSSFSRIPLDASSYSSFWNSKTLSIFIFNIFFLAKYKNLTYSINAIVFPSIVHHSLWAIQLVRSFKAKDDCLVIQRSAQVSCTFFLNICFQIWFCSCSYLWPPEYLWSLWKRHSIC